jgi:carbonic anhydrase/acetyltransferase-like protein (isoleucine patch superfamily)
MRYKFDGHEPVTGTDTYISETAIVIGDVQIGDNCYIGHGAILRGDYGRIEIGSGSAIEEGVVVHAPPDNTCSIGEKVTVGHGAIIHSKSIGDFSVIGMGAIVSIGAEIGEGAIVAEGCIVKAGQTIPAHMVVAGNPAKTLREVSQKEKDFSSWANQLYIDLAKKYLKEGMQRID